MKQKNRTKSNLRVTFKDEEGKGDLSEIQYYTLEPNDEEKLPILLEQYKKELTDYTTNKTTAETQLSLFKKQHETLRETKRSMRKSQFSQKNQELETKIHQAKVKLREVDDIPHPVLDLMKMRFTENRKLLDYVKEHKEQRLFVRAKFDSSHADSVDFSDLDLDSAKFRKAQLQNAKLCRANLNNAIMTSANLEGADLTGTILLDVDLITVKGLKYAHRLDLAWMGNDSHLPANFPPMPSSDQILSRKNISVYEKIQLLQKCLFTDSYSFRSGKDLDTAIITLAVDGLPEYYSKDDKDRVAEDTQSLRKDIPEFIRSVKQFRSQLITKELTPAPIMTEFTSKEVLQILSFMHNVWDINEGENCWFGKRTVKISQIFGAGEELPGWQHDVLEQAVNCGWIENKNTNGLALSESGIINFAKYLELLARDPDKSWRFKAVLEANPRLGAVLETAVSDSKSLQQNPVLTSQELTTQQVLQILSYVFKKKDINFSKISFWSGEKTKTPDKVMKIFATPSVINAKKLSYLIKAADLAWDEIKTTDGISRKLSEKGRISLVNWLSKESEQDIGVKQRVDCLSKANPWLQLPLSTAVLPHTLKP